MAFLQGLFLLAAFAAAIPVLLHMISRQKAKDLPFPTLRFLKVSVEKTRRRRRIQDLFLMLLRMAVLILIALALADPTITNLSKFWGGGNSAIAIIVDNSASMGTIDSDQPRLETALGAAMQVMDELQDGDQVALFLPCGPTFTEQSKLDRSQDKVRQMLSQVKISYEKADLALQVQQARSVLQESNAGSKQIYVITDMQGLCWEGLAASGDSSSDDTSADSTSSTSMTSQAIDPARQKELDEMREIPIIVVDCNRMPKPNVAVTDVDIKMAIPIAGVPIAAGAELVNTSEVQQQRHLELYIDSQLMYTSPSLTIEPESRTRHDFQFTLDRGGLHRCEVRLVGDDGSPLDDRRFFAMEVDQGIPVAIVRPEDHEIDYLNDSYYVEEALMPGDSGNWAIRTTTLTADELISEPLSNFVVIYCVNLPTSDPDTTERLAQYVQRGGHIVWIGGDNVDPLLYNEMDTESGHALLPVPLVEVRTPLPEEDRDSWNWSWLDATHQAMTHLTEPASLYQSVLVYQFITQDAESDPGAQVLARLDGGEPILVQRSVGQGSVTMLGSSAHVGWTNLPIRPLFLPLLARLTFDLAGAEQSRYQGIAGSPLVVQLDDEIRPGAFEVIPPSGARVRLSSDEPAGTVSENNSGAFRFAETHEIGIYSVRPLETARSKVIAYSVNLDPDEAQPENLSAEELEKRFGDTPVVFAEDPDDLSGTFDWLRKGKSLWTLVLWFVLIVLVFECFVSNLLSPRRDDEQIKEVAIGMRRLAKKGRA